MRTSLVFGTVATALASNALAATGATSNRVKNASGTAGCGEDHTISGVTLPFGLTSSGRDRSYSVHIPFGYDENKPYPVVLGFHGSDSIGLFFEVDTRMSSSDYTPDKIMVYPDGVDGAWAGANYSSVSVDEDLQFISDLLDALRDSYCVDDSRIYATG